MIRIIRWRKSRIRNITVNFKFFVINVKQPLFHGNNKSDKEIEFAIKNNIKVIVDNDHDLKRLEERLDDLVEICKIRGQILLDSEDINEASQDPVLLRMKIGMVFQKPNPFPKSIYDNVAFGPKLHGMAKSKEELDNIVIQSLSKSGLYEEVKDRLFEPGTGLSGGQQQRLCIARALAVNPQILLMDEPCSALDPIATAKIEDLIAELKQQYTIVIVTHSMQQAARVSDRTAYMHMGELVETGLTKTIFSNPQHEKTQDYITGRIG